MTVPQIARRLGVSRQNVQRVPNDLVANGLATFQSNPDHKSSPLVCLTPAGEQAIEQINTAAARHNQAIAEQLSERNVDKLRSLLGQLTRALQGLIDTNL